MLTPHEVMLSVAESNSENLTLDDIFLHATFIDRLDGRGIVLEAWSGPESAITQYLGEVVL